MVFLSPPARSHLTLRTRLLGLMAAALVAGLPFSARAAAQESASRGTSGQAEISYSRVLKGSLPEVIVMTVDSTGAGTYDGRKISDPPSPRKMQLTPATTRRIFALAAELNDFHGIELESHKNVANMGKKTFTYLKDGRKNSVEFNYTLNRKGTELMNLFEGIAVVEQHLTALEFAVRYDPLGLPHELLTIQGELNNKALENPQLMIPVLEKIAKDPRFLHVAQIRAQSILEHVQNPD
jgi:hypothetical protein